MTDDAVLGPHGWQLLGTLAHRCMNDEPNQELDDLISRWFGRHMYRWWSELVRSGSKFTRCRDDAATLVPPYWRLAHMQEYLVGGNWGCNLVCNHPDYGGSKDGKYIYALAKTEAAARTAAALLAHAHMLKDRKTW